MGRIQGLSESGPLQTSKSLKSVQGYVFSISIGWAGCTAGKCVALRDGSGAAGELAVVFPFATANGFMSREWSQGKWFDSGIFFDKDTADGSIWVEITYK